MCQFASYVLKPTTEERNTMFALLGSAAYITGSTVPSLTGEQIATLYSPGYVPPNMDQQVVIVTKTTP
ncbi:hypothetical protein TWF506_003040 [Arthrobotrys conoides]|uniref:Uncharacterized protein n=1 Tax=Arthrobotrys conoides TaxID=74498 RepID=A0AAN8N4V5_9PEZI